MSIGSQNNLKFDLNLIKHIKIESVCLIIFAVVLLWFMSVFNGGLIAHPAPYNYNAGDMFTYAIYAEAAKFEGDTTYLPIYLSQGVPEILNTFVVTGAFIAAELSLFTGIESYDFIMQVTLLFLVLSIFMIFSFLNRISGKWAIFALPMSLLVFKWPFQYAITWGMCGSPITMLFAIVGLFCMRHLTKRYMFIILGILNGAGFLAHARETLMFNLGIALYFLVRLIKEKIPQDIIAKPSRIVELLKENETLVSLRNYLFSIFITLLMMFKYYPILLSFLFAKSAKYAYGTSNNLISYMPPWLPHHVYFSQFGFFKYIIFIGVIVGILFILFKKTKTTDLILTMSIMFLLNGFFSILGNKTTQVPHLFPILLMPLTGLVLFILFAYLKKIIKYSSLIALALFLIILIPTIIYHYPNQVSEYAFADPPSWEAVKWIQSNVNDSEKILILYGDKHTQDTIFYMMRKNQFRTNREEYLQKVSSNQISSNISASGYVLAEYFRKINGTYSYNSSANSIKMEKPVCYYDYVYSDKISRIPQIQAYTLKLLDKLVKESNFIPVFQNGQVIILKNNNVGGKCFTDEVVA